MKFKVIDGKYVERFSKYIRLAHWVHAISFIMLTVTALPVYSHRFAWVFTVFGGAEVTTILHRSFGITFLLPTLYIIIKDRQGFAYWTKQLLKWKPSDIKFFVEYGKEFFGMKGDVPKQGFYNAGQKMNSILTICASASLGITGLLIMFKAAVPKAIIAIVLPLHSLSAACLVAIIFGHIFLSIGHPDSRPSFRGMTKGSVTVDYAKSHHEEWYDEVVEDNKKNAS